MDTSMNPQVLSQFSELIEARMGLYFPQERWRDLERKMRTITQAFAFEDAEACAQWLVSSPLSDDQIKLLASHLTVGETYFLREKRTWEVLQEDILPQLISSRWGADQRLRFWSAACCSGEEPYSIAMVLNQVLPNTRGWHNTILATDINPRFLQRATEGVYGKWSFRGVPQEIQRRYFRPTDNGLFALQPEIKHQVTFAQLNLVEDSYPSLATNTNAMDIILCRNILIYFTQERAQRVIEHLYRALVDGGWLIVSPVEVPYVTESPFIPVHFPGLTLFRKDTSSPRKPFSFPKPDSRQTAFRVPDLSPPPPVDLPLPPTEPTIPVAIVTSAPVQDQSQQDQSQQDQPQQTARQAEESSPAAGQPPLTAEAQALYEQGHYAQAVEKLLTLCTAESESADGPALALLARAFANQGQLDEAQAWCEKAIAADTRQPGLYYLQSTILLEQGDVANARLALTRTLYLDPDFVLAHFALGNLARQQNKTKEANKHFENALSLLQRYAQDDVLPESEGISAGRLAEIVAAMRQK